VLGYLDDLFIPCRTDEDGAVAVQTCHTAAAKVGLSVNKKPEKSCLVDTRKMVQEGTTIELLGARFGAAGAAAAAWVKDVGDLEGYFERLMRWVRTGDEGHLVLTLLRICAVPSRAHLARCEPPSVARAGQRLLEMRVLACLRGIVGEGVLSPESELLATLPARLSGCGLEGLAAHREEFGFGYAASVMLSHAVLRARDINLDVGSVPEAAEAIDRGVINLNLDSGIDWTSWTTSDMVKLQARMSHPEHVLRLAQLILRLQANPSWENSVRLTRLLEHMTPTSYSWLTGLYLGPYMRVPTGAMVLGLRRRLLLVPMPGGRDQVLCRCGVTVKKDSPFDAASISGAGPDYAAAFPAVDMEDEEELVDAWTAAIEELRSAGQYVAAAADQYPLAPESMHAEKCPRAATKRTTRHDECVRVLVAFLRQAGFNARREREVGLGRKRSDIHLVDGNKHFDLCVCNADCVIEAGAWPKLADRLRNGELCGGSVPEVEKFLQQALPVALRAVTRAEDFKRKKYAGSHQEVVPLGFSAGGACLERTWNAIPFDPKGTKEAEGGKSIRAMAAVGVSVALLNHLFYVTRAYYCQP
jgi:hypothetical protein